MPKRVSNEILGEYKCPRCGWVHVAITKEHAQVTCDDWMALQCCFNCKRPAVGFLPAGPDDVPNGCTLQPVVLWHARELDEDEHIRTEMRETVRCSLEKSQAMYANAASLQGNTETGPERTPIGGMTPEQFDAYKRQRLVDAQGRADDSIKELP